MGVSLDQLPYDSATIYTDRWLFQLSDELRGPHGGANFDLGVVTDPVDTRVLRRFICAHGKAMIGALRVVGEECELGDCSALKPKSDEPEALPLEQTPPEQTQPEQTPPEPQQSAAEPTLELAGKSDEHGSVAPEHATAPAQTEEPTRPSQRPSLAADSVRPSASPSSAPDARSSSRPTAFEGGNFDPLLGISRKGEPSK